MTSASSLIPWFRYSGPSTHLLIVYWPWGTTFSYDTCRYEGLASERQKSLHSVYRRAKYMNKGTANSTKSLEQTNIGYVAVVEVLRKPWPTSFVYNNSDGTEVRPRTHQHIHSPATSSAICGLLPYDDIKWPGKGNRWQSVVGWRLSGRLSSIQGLEW